MVTTSSFLPGALVQARGRTWVVMPAEEQDVLRLRPVDGSDADLAGIFLGLEPRAVVAASYLPPDPSAAGDFTGALLLRDAVRLSLRSGAGPFRSLGRLSFTPRPYQFVPLIMALRLEQVRLLIADDVGVGKTIEAAMIARELLDRGVIRRIGVLCPPHLCEQWEQELREKFGIGAVVVQPSKMARLERDLPRADVGIFQHYPHVVCSIDFIKAGSYRGAFLDNAPDLIIVDEAHAAARPRGNTDAGQHQRYALLRDVADLHGRHLVLTTATPHSGIEESFRSLLGLLDKSFDLAADLEMPRRPLLPHVIQRRRGELERWLGDDTPFPKRDAVEMPYRMAAPYVKLYEDVLEYCRESVSAAGAEGSHQQRVRYWAAIAILRCLLSSPKAAEAMLDKRADKHRRADAPESAEGVEVDLALSGQVLDSDAEDGAPDYAPVAPLDEAMFTDQELARLDGFLKTARSLVGQEHDKKLAECATVVSGLLSEGYRPIVFCRFIATADYVAEQLQKLLGATHSGLRVRAVTGAVGDEQRREIVDGLAEEKVRVLVATDCLSEGINLQKDFDAVVHYDLPWNPNRLEQREGRIDRYGQEKKTVKTVLLYGADNPIDLVVLDVLIRKARLIRSRLGIAVPVPVESEQVVQAVIDSVLLRRGDRSRQIALPLEGQAVSGLHAEWDRAADREEKTRAFFSQEGIKPDEVAHELQEMVPVLGSESEVRRFVADAIQRFNGELRPTRNPAVFDLMPGDLGERIRERDATIKSFPLRMAFEGIAPERVAYVGRDHPVVATLAEAVIGRALEGDGAFFRRSGAIYTDAVAARIAVLVLRLRYLLDEGATPQFAEEVVVAAFRPGANGGFEWLEPLDSEGLRLLTEAEPKANIATEERQQQVEWALARLSGNRDWWKPVVAARSQALAAAHQRLRSVVKSKPLRISEYEPDVLGCYVLVPTSGAR